MYIEKLTLKNIRNFKEFCWVLNDDEPRAGWHVLLGDNGAGKSTIIKTCVLPLLHGDDISALRADLNSWVGLRAEECSSEVVLTGKDTHCFSIYHKHGKFFGYQCTNTPPSSIICSFGPFRRFTGGSDEYGKLSASNPRLARHLSLFGEDIALAETLAWLKDLHYQKLDALSRGEPEPQDGLLEKVTDFINQDELLPNQTQLTEISPKGVFFTDITGAKVALESLSDGFRSVLSLTLELIRQLAMAPETKTLFSDDNQQIIAPGIVLIDEVDVHLHPRWQRTIGPWLTHHFPNIQFIVTTHSPLVCQGAQPGTVTRLPQPGVEDDQGERLSGTALNRLLYGDILEAISSGAFGSGIERSDEGKQKLQRLALLNRKARRQGLDDLEAEERQQLQTIFGDDAD